LYSAPALCLAAPVYFYHLPAAFKALIDRTQPFWAMASAPVSPPKNSSDGKLERYPAGGGVLSQERPGRICHVILVGARHKGEKLFEGSLLTLRTALAPLGVKLAEPLLLRGLDEADALATDSTLSEEVLCYGKTAGVEFKSREV
jgi:multimeric flavodoxin WrbA